MNISYNSSDIIPVQLYAITGQFRVSEKDFLVRLEERFPIAKIGTHFDIPFGGHIGVDGIGRFQGQLIDYFGASFIEGTLAENFLNFSKNYLDRNYTIEYHLIGDIRRGFKGKYKSYIDSVSVHHEGDEASAIVTPTQIKLPLLAFSSNLHNTSLSAQ